MIQYLFLLFDEGNPIHKDDSNFVFTTEGHILTLPQQHLRPLSPVRRKLRRAENLQCPAYVPQQVGATSGNTSSGLFTGIRYRSDVDYARSLVGAATIPSDARWWSPYGQCDVPVVDIYVRLSVAATLS